MPRHHTSACDSIRASARGSRARRAASAVALLVLAAVAVLTARPADADAFAQRVSTDFFGVNGQAVIPLSRPATGDPAALERHLDAIQSTGVGWVRAGLSWALVEQDAPLNGVHRFNWINYDGWVTELAKHGLRWHPTINNAPAWAQDPELLDDCTGRARQMLPPDDPRNYAAVAWAVARRYGANGAFWQLHPELPQLPVREYELFNEVNDKAYFCPKPDPARYAHLYVAARDAIHQADPSARAVVGGLAPNRYKVASDDPHRDDILAPDFIAGMLAAEPTLATKLDTLGIHSYRRDPADVLADIAWFRRTLERLGLGAASIEVTESGWHTSGGDPSAAVGESLRAASYRKLAHDVGRTDCDLAGFAPFTWNTPEQDPANPEHWFGIAAADSGLYPSAAAYRDEVKLFLGKGPQAAPRSIEGVCGNAVPDTDGDGVLDPDDDYPVDPARSSGSGEHNSEDDPAPQERFQPARAADEFFGVTGIGPVRGKLAEEESAHYAAMATAGIHSARGFVSWKTIEPDAPTAAHHDYLWGTLDRSVRRMAAQGIRFRPVLNDIPAWALEFGAGTQSRAEFAGFARLFAQRYGPGGAFWDENRGLPRLPVTDYEIWLRGNISSVWVDGSASPSEYADFYLAARSAIRSADPAATVSASLSATGDWSAPAFIAAMREARPAIAGALDGIHLATVRTDLAGIEEHVATARAALDASGNGDAAITLEVAYPQAGPGAIADAERRSRIRTLLDRAARSDCGLSGVYPRAWVSAEGSTASAENWTGIARPVDGSLYLAAEGLRQASQLYTGRTTQRAPYATVHVCGAEAPDHDGDGTPDEADDYPLDASAVSGSDADGDGIFNDLDPDFSDDGGDTTPPVVRIDAGPTAVTADPTPSFTFSSEAGAVFECRFDTQAAFGPCSAAGSHTATASLPAGERGFWVRARDEAGNQSAPVSRTFTLDTSGPRVSFDAAPPAQTNNRTPRFEFSATAPGSAAVSGFECRFDADAFAACGAPFETAQLAEGAHTFAVRATDEFGNVGTAASHDFTVDLTAPIAHFDSGPGARVSSPSVGFAFSAVGRAVAFECSLDGAGFGPCSSPHQAGDLAEGSHSFAVRARDAADNASEPVVRAFIVDLTSPGAPSITEGPAGGPGGVTRSGAADFSWSGEQGGGYECALDNGSFGTCSSPRHLSGLAAGEYTFAVRQRDTAGNVSPVATYAWAVDAGVPDTRLEGWRRKRTRDRTPRFSFELSGAESIARSAEDVSTSFRCRIDRRHWRACGSPFRPKRLRPGWHRFRVRATDDAGNLGRPDRVRFKVVR